MAYLMRAGVLETEEGDAFAIVAEADGQVATIAVGESFSGAMDEAVTRLLGQELAVHPSLADEAKRRGLEVAAPTDVQKEMRATLAVAFAHGALLPPPKTSGVMREFLQAAVRLRAAAPWRAWSGDVPVHLKFRALGKKWVSAAIFGELGEAYGIGLYLAGGHEKAGRGVQPKDLLALYVDPEAETESEEIAADAMEEWSGIRFIPAARNLAHGRPAELKDEDLMVLAAVANAVSGLTPERLKTDAQVTCGGRLVSVPIEAPPPDLREKSALDRLADRLDEYSLNRFGVDPYEAAISEFPEMEDEDDDDELFVPWALFSMPLEGKPVARWFREEAADQLDEAERQLLDQELQARWSIWRVESVNAEAGTLGLADLLSDQRVTVTAKIPLTGGEGGTTLLGRVAPHEPVAVLSGNHPIWMDELSALRVCEALRAAAEAEGGSLDRSLLADPIFQLVAVREWEEVATDPNPF